MIRCMACLVLQCRSLRLQDSTTQAEHGRQSIAGRAGQGRAGQGRAGQGRAGHQGRAGQGIRGGLGRGGQGCA